MNPENLALAQEEATLTKIRNFLNGQKVKLWEPPYYDTERKIPNEESLHELAVSITSQVNLPRGHVLEGLQMLLQNALEKLAARDKFKESGVATFKLRCSKNLKCRQKSCDIDIQSTGHQLAQLVSELVNQSQEKLKLIVSGRLVEQSTSLAEQGVKNNSTVMIILIQDQEALAVVAEQRKMLSQTRADAERLSTRDSRRDDYYLQVADQSGKSLDLPQEERTSLIIAMSLHEKGRAALKRKQYSVALVLLLEAEREFSQCNSELLQMVDNYAILSLDIAWCYLTNNVVSELPDADIKLARCEEKFKSSYGNNMERVAALKGSQSNELALMARLHLLQGVVAFHLGRDREARLQLEKVSTEMQLLSVDEVDLLEIVSLGYSIAEARLGLRASLGDRKLAVDHIMRRREEKAEILKKEKEERERGKLREKLGRCGNGDWVNVGYYKTLLTMGYTSKVAGAALRQANNSLNTAVQMLQEEPDMIAMAAEERDDSLEEPSDEMIASVVAMGFTTDMARAALQNEGSVEGAVDKLMEGGGVVEVKEEQASQGKRRRKNQEDEEAYNRIKDDMSDMTEGNEDNLDLDLVEEGQLLQQYLSLLGHVKL